jgi:hypothetical protein
LPGELLFELDHRALQLFEGSSEIIEGVLKTW